MAARRKLRIVFPQCGTKISVRLEQTFRRRNRMHVKHDRSFWTRINLPVVALSAVVSALMVAASPCAPAQTLTVLHSFTGGSDGSNPAAGLTVDAAGNFYGTTPNGGAGYGTVFKLSPSRSGRVLS